MENIIIPPKPELLKTKYAICPCCGHKFEGSLFEGCPQCESRAIGEPLSRPEFQLPSFGRSVFLGAIGGLLLIVFFISTLVAHFERIDDGFGFWSVLSSMEVAAWRLKWVAIPLSILSVWSGLKICKGIRLQPQQFMWRRLAQMGFAASVLFAFLTVTCIGITVPERLRKRQHGFEAQQKAKLYLIDKTFFAYRQQFGTLPTSPSDLKNLPDPDGSIALIISFLEEQSTYKPTTDLAKLEPLAKTPTIRNASLTSSTDISTSDKVEYTNYEVRIAGNDGIYGNEDDFIIRDGVVLNAEPLSPNQIPITLKKVDDK